MRQFGLVVYAALLLAICTAGSALAQKRGGVLKIYFFDQHVSQSGLNSIVPDLATEWSWNEERTQLTFRLRQGVKWHDGKPFTAKDIKCTFDLLLGNAPEKLRLNPRKPWYRNLDEVVLKGDDEVIFRL